ncbi:MAG: hypothetical protein CL402_00405 [Acidiferrobacteraceae bacterium]|nr:hypothetical protein [Acidiferrobacteraceae bacterium]|tara:strand:- start:94 stop:1047 length:954 start_codon:yes stop_codon:yes gene_type:complete
MATNLSTSNLWWISLVQCPICYEKPFKENLRGKLKCLSCDTKFELVKNRIDWTPEHQITQGYDRPKNKWDLLKRCINPLSNPLLPFRYWIKLRTEQFYKRTINDNRLAESWANHYLSGIRLPENATILDHGCGRGRSIGLLNQNGFKVVGQDMIADNWWKNFDKNGFQILPPNYTKLPWRDSSFDLVTNIMVIGYLPREKLDCFVKEICRVLKPNGYWLILEANDKSLGRRLFNREYENPLPLNTMRVFAKNHKFKEIDVSYEAFYAPFFPILINFIRKQCGPWQFDISDYDSWLAKQISPEKRGQWLMRLKCLKNE